jgi:hypothetical protein
LLRTVFAHIDGAFSLRRACRGHRPSDDALAKQGLALPCELEQLASGHFMYATNRRLAGHVLNHATHFFWLLVDPEPISVQCNPPDLPR